MIAHRHRRHRLRRSDHRRLLRPPRPRGHLRRRRSPTRSPGSPPARSRSSSTASTDLVDEGLRSGRLQFVLGAANAVDGLRDRVPLRADAAGRRRLRRPVVHRGGGRARSRPLLPYESVVVNKSTVPVGSTKRRRAGARRGPTSRSCRTPSSSARARPCSDFLKPDRVVVGATTRPPPIKVVVALRSASPRRSSSPTRRRRRRSSTRPTRFLATKLSFVNAIAAICEGVGADVNDVVLGIGYDKRIGQDFLRPGPGWGGSCFPKDSRALLKIADDAGYYVRPAAGRRRRQRRAVRAGRPSKIADRRRRLTSRGKTIGGVGPHVQGPHRRPARLAVARRSSSACWPAGATVQAYDPTVSGPEARPARRHRDLRRPVRRRRGRRRARRADRVGRLPLARPGQGRRRR